MDLLQDRATDLGQLVANELGCDGVDADAGVLPVAVQVRLDAPGNVLQLGQQPDADRELAHLAQANDAAVDRGEGLVQQGVLVALDDRGQGAAEAPHDVAGHVVGELPHPPVVLGAGIGADLVGQHAGQHGRQQQVDILVQIHRIVGQQGIDHAQHVDDELHVLLGHVEGHGVGDEGSQHGHGSVHPGIAGHDLQAGGTPGRRQIRAGLDDHLEEVQLLLGNAPDRHAGHGARKSLRFVVLPVLVEPKDGAKVEGQPQGVTYLLPSCQVLRRLGIGVEIVVVVDVVVLSGIHFFRLVFSSFFFINWPVRMLDFD